MSTIPFVPFPCSNRLTSKAAIFWVIKPTEHTSQEATYTIPPQSNCNEPWSVDWHTYKERHLVECFFQQIKWFRRIFTRYDKLDASFLAFVYIAAIMVLLK
jgi:transposase